MRSSVETAESSLPPTPSTLASLRISTDTWSQLPDSPATKNASQFTETQLLAAELEARNQALRLLLGQRGGTPAVGTELSAVSEGAAATPEAATVSPRSSTVAPAPEPEPEPEPEPGDRRLRRQQRSRTTRTSNTTPRALTPQAAASVARLTSQRTNAADAHSRLAARPSGNRGLPAWVPGGASVRSSSSSVGDGAESMSLRAHASRAHGRVGKRLSKSAGGHTGGSRNVQSTGRSRAMGRPRPAWASPPPAPSVAADSSVDQKDIVDRGRGLDGTSDELAQPTHGRQQVCLLPCTYYLYTCC